MTVALIMAGGRGERMRVDGTTVPKPLVPIWGVPLLERNILSLLYSGFHEIVVAVPSHTPQIAGFVRSRGKSLADAVGGQLRLFQETQPLGNIGAAAKVDTGGRALLVIYADNLTSLDLKALVGHHSETGAGLTSAVHFEPFRIPYGEVEVHDGMVVAYREKPEHRVLVSSGVFVLGSSAVRHLPPDQRKDVAWLVNRLLAEQVKVTAFLHDAPWIDVNDAHAISRAEQLLASNPGAFENPAALPDHPA